MMNEESNTPRVVETEQAVTGITSGAAAQKEYQEIFEGALEGIFRTTPQGQILTANPALATMLGYASALDLTSASLSFVHQLWLDQATRSRCNAAMEELGIIRGYECQLKRKEGNGIWVSINSRKISGPDGQTAYYEGFITDITGRMRTEAAQHESERRLRELLENIHLVSAILDQKGNITFCNDFLLTLTGWKREEIMGCNWCDLFVPPGQYDKELISRQISERAVPHQAKNEIITKAGERRMISWNNTILFDAAGNPQGVATIGEDITDRIRLENELRQAQKLESIGRLAGGVAHDFNNLLTIINGYTDFILNELKSSDPIRSYADEIKIAGKRAANLTKQLLAFSRKQVIEPKVLDLNNSIQESETLLHRVIGEDVALTTTLDPLLWQVMADPEQIHQVMMNLVVNARDAMPEGGSVTISTANIDLSEAEAFRHPHARAGCYVMLSVTDSGVGMDDQTRQHIFEPFFTTKELGKGTGLGLATVYGIVRQSDGWISVTSEVGFGTSFKLHFPCIAPSVVVVKEEREPEPSRCEGPFGGETILMVEDDAAVRHFTKVILLGCGFHVLEASNGEEGLQIAKKHLGDIDLLMTDVVLPGINGMEVSERLKAIRPLVKVLFVSGYTADVIARRGVLNPGVSLLHKPFTADGLASKIRDVLAEPAKAILGG